MASGLYSKATQPVSVQGGSKRALIYLGRTSAAGAPRPGYLESVLAAAEAAQLPLAYRAELRTWLRGPQGEARAARETRP